MNNCPYYGRALYANAVMAVPFILIDSRGNQCALVTKAHAPCRMEMDGQEPDWKLCPLVKDIRMEGV